ncbi:MAG TPA: SMC-Scp complex subunit ScpB [Candidatus Nanoarchaeia archaeon]|nr:SMC-Scp complex subunit ScpB [Candidatus Nanoarchaeia archaeon]
MEISKETVNEFDNARDIENLKKVEAALFICGKFLSVEELVALTDLNPILLNEALDKILEKYDETSAIEILNKGDMWKMDVKPEYIDIVNKMATGNNEFSKAEQETLAVIAHKQPISQAKVILMRGNKAYEHVRKFVDLGLITSKKSGRTRELNLSEEFYNYFNLAKKEKVKKEEDS